MSENIALHKRIPEPELMDQEEQVEAYAFADFSAPHEMFVDLFQERFGANLTGCFLDLGCGPCDVTIRFAKRYPQTRVHAVDGSEPMLRMARQRIEREGLSQRIKLFQKMVPLKKGDLPEFSYDGVIVNSLLHHLPSQELLWQTIEDLMKPSGLIFVMDLLRPSNAKSAREIVEKYSGDEPEILKQDFYNSLLAAYRPDEVVEFLKRTRLSSLTLEKVSDRHFIIWGKK